MPDPQTDPNPVTDWPLWWFAKLEQAVEEGDHQAAAEAQKELDRLGVKVHFGRPSRYEEAVHV
jgi:hypothetical protein